MRKRIQELESKRPIAEIKPKTEGKSAYLEIINRGQYKSSFEVRISEWEGLEDITPEMRGFYNARWEVFDLKAPNAIDSTLKSNGSNRVILLKDEGLASLS